MDVRFDAVGEVKVATSTATELLLPPFVPSGRLPRTGRNRSGKRRRKSARNGGSRFR